MNNRGRGFNRRQGGFRGIPRGGGPFRGRDWTPRGGGRGGYLPRFNTKVRRTDNTPGKRLSEASLGITEYVSVLPGFNGIIKSRFSDFQVSEVNINGEVAQLTDLSAPVSLQGTKTLKDDEDIFDKYNLEVFPVETWDILNNIVMSSDKTSKHEVDVTQMTKEERTKVYAAIETAFGNRLYGQTITSGDKKMIIFSKLPHTHRDTREKWYWPGRYVHFVVFKENLDTMEAAVQIAQALHLAYVKPQFFGYCGTKDRRAKTSQWFSLHRVDPARICSAGKRLRNIHIGNFTFKDHHLYLGYLSGNIFKIALRNITATDETINQAMEHLRDFGFVNYYGLQRFGTVADIPTHKIGHYILQRKYQIALDLILEPRGPYAEVLAYYRNTRDAWGALQLVSMPSQTTELRLLTAIAQCNKNDLVSILDRIPRNTRLLYLHSYQSWVWNRCVSERIKRFGLKLSVGDLVPEDPQIDVDDNAVFFKEDIWSGNENSDDEDVINKVAFQQREATLKNRATKFPNTDKKEVKVKALTQEDIDSNAYTIYDLVLPLPGYKVQYPSNMDDYYAEIRKEDQVDLNIQQKVKAYNLSGTYRKMLIKPENLSWTTLQYSNPFCDLILSDLDVMNGTKPIESIPDGKFKALIITMTLRSSTYATMALRELLKRDTSSESQARQNDYYKDNSSGDGKESEKTSGNGDSKDTTTDTSVTESTDKLVTESTDKLVTESTDKLVIESTDKLLTESTNDMVTESTDDLVNETTNDLVTEAVESSTEKRKPEDDIGDDSKKVKLS